MAGKGLGLKVIGDFGRGREGEGACGFFMEWGLASEIVFLL